MAKTICIMCATYRDALFFSERYINDNRHNILKISKTPSYIMVQMLDGEMNYFMSSYSYYFWCKGRTYELDGKMYHSGYLLKEIKMTNIDLIGFIKKRIGKYIDDRKKSLKESEKYFDSKSKYIDALNCQFRKDEDEIIKLGIEDEIDKLIEFLNLDTEDSKYKEMWTELKEKIGDRVRDHFLIMGTNIDYLKKAVSEIRHEEAGGILWEMKNIEEERDIE